MKKINKNYRLLVGILALVTISQVSCITTPVCLTASNTPLHNKVIGKNLGPVRGESDPFRGAGVNGISILMLWLLGKPDIDSAMNDALSKKGGDALINIRCYERTYYYLIFSTTRVIVEGEAIEFK